MSVWDNYECDNQINMFNAQEVDVRGFCDDGYCPVCNASLEDLTERCTWCGTLLSWNRWRQINGKNE